MMGPMGFFDFVERDLKGETVDVEDDDDEFEERRPGPWIPGIVAVEVLVARSDEAAIVVSRIAAYPDGFELTVHSYLHRSVKGSRRRRLPDPMMWQDPTGAGGPLAGEVLRFGLAWPDGGKATNLDSRGCRWPDATEAAHSLELGDGGGSDRDYAQEYRAWPLPGPGTLSIVAKWPAFAIEESTVTLDAGLIADAAARARPVWPEDAAKASHVSRMPMTRSVSEHHAPEGPGFTDL